MSRVSMFLPPCWLFCLCAAAAEGELPAEPCQVQFLTSGGGPLSDAFGWSLAIDGDYLVVGAHADSSQVQSGGVVYVYKRGPYTLTEGTWHVQAKLLPPNPKFEQGFGLSIDLDGDVLVVGAPGISFSDGSQVGEAYVFRRTGNVWTQVAQLVSSGSSEGDNFGASVAIDGGVIAVGADGEDTYTGTAYVFQHDGTAWNEAARLRGSASTTGDGFGTSLDVAGPRLIVGAPFEDPADPGNPKCKSGAAYAYEHNGIAWVEESKLVPSDTACHHVFGHSVALDGSTVVVGATGHSGGAGAAYVFIMEAGSWQQQGLLIASDGAPPEHLGRPVAIDGDCVLVGSPEHDTPSGVDSGAVYLYIRQGTSWQESRQFVPSSDGCCQEFGAGLTISGPVIAAGVPAQSRAEIYSFFPSLPCIPAASVVGLAGLGFAFVLVGGILLRRRGVGDSSARSSDQEESHGRRNVACGCNRSRPPPTTKSGF
jgi:hypothetical protein